MFSSNLIERQEALQELLKLTVGGTLGYIILVGIVAYVAFYIVDHDWF